MHPCTHAGLTLVACAAMAGTLPACEPKPQVVQSPVAQHGCLRCHSGDGNTVGAPDFATISRRYADDQGAAAALGASLKGGSHGKWSEYQAGAMPPQAQLSESERKALVEWILTQPH